MKEVDIISKVVGRDTSGKTAMYIPGAGAPSVNLDDYLLKKIWDSVFEIRTDSEGNPYLFEKMPFVTQYGITMYADGGDLDLPGIYAGLPIDNQTLYWENGVLKAKGGTEGAITSITSDMVVDALGYTPAKASDIPSLSGYATETYVEDRLDDLINGAPAAYDTLKEIADVLAGNVDSIGDIITTLGTKADKATTLAGYGITDAYTKTKVDELLSLYVTLGTAQTITGEKDFTGGLKVNGSPIVYDATNKYWKLEGDLLVTGGVTMFASDSDFTPSTIMDAIATDGTNLKVVNGVLTFVGSIDGGEAGSVAWENVTGKPSWIGTSKPSYAWSEITGKPSFATVATSGKYSDLSGTPTLLSSFTNDVGFITSFTDTKNTAGATNTSSKIFLIGATAQNANPQTYSHDTAYVGTDGCLYSGGSKVLTAHQTIYNLTFQAGSFSAKTFDPNGAAMTVNIPTTTSHISEGSNLYFTNARAVSALSSTLSGYLPLSGGTLTGTLQLKLGTTRFGLEFENSLGALGSDGEINFVLPQAGTSYIRSGQADLYHRRGGKDLNYKILDEYNYSAILDGRYYTEGEINSKLSGYLPLTGGTLTGNLIVEDNVANLISIKRTANSAGAFIDYLNNGQSAIYWRVGAESSNIFSFLPNGNPNTNKVSISYEGHLNVGASVGQQNEGRAELSVVSLGDSPCDIMLGSNSVACWSITSRHNAQKDSFYLYNYGKKGVNLEADFNSFSVRIGYGSISEGIKDMDSTYALDVVGYTRSNRYYGADGNLAIIAKSGYNVELQANGGAAGYKVCVDIETQSFRPFSDTHTLLDIGSANIYWRNIYAQKTILKSATADILSLYRKTSGGGAWIDYYANNQESKKWRVGAGSESMFEWENAHGVHVFKMYDSGDFIVTGGITMYSDQRKKTILNHVELSLSQIANAPLIEHYYNSDDKHTTHVGSIAQYWVGLNDWFCKLDNEGFYTMEIQNAALASAISIARELVKYESKTDKEIRLLKDEVKRLKKEIKILKSA